MDKTLTLKNATISAVGNNFLISCGKLSLTVSFDETFGFTVTSFKNLCGSRSVEYISAPQPLSPFKYDDGLKKVEKAEVVSDAPVFNAGEDIIQSEVSAETQSWKPLDFSVRKKLYGGVNALNLTARITNGKCNLTLDLFAFPECSVIRYCFHIENLTYEAASYTLSPFKMGFGIDRALDCYRAHWFKGAAPNYEYGNHYEQAFGCNNKKIEIASHMTANFVPLFAITRDDIPQDGIAVEMDYTAHWSLNIDKVKCALVCEYNIDDDKGVISLDPGENIASPLITIAMFSGDLDDMMVELYDWQYQYMWDYTLNDYFAKTRSFSCSYPWVYCSRILNEQFTYRLTGMDLMGAKEIAEVGYDINWDDAGWSAFPGWPDDGYGSVFKNNYESPDHRLSTRFFEKVGIKRLLWFAGKPTPGLLDTKQGAWGLFEWRTDGLSNWSYKDEIKFKKNITDYLDADVRRSFHTCSGGACYSNTFDIQRYANYHYAADNGAGPYVNYYYSYFAQPDRWGDILFFLGNSITGNDGGSAMYGSSEYEPLYYNPAHARSRLSLVPYTGFSNKKNIPSIREDLEIYRYFIEKGIAGRWSYMFHPGVYGDKDFYYMQRTSRDRLRACIIIRRCPFEKRVMVFPKGLIANENYTVSFQISDVKYVKTGKELMEEGIILKNTAPGELIYFNLPDSPGKVTSAAIPVISKVFKRAENNVGSSGVGIYWTPDQKGTWTRYYEVSKNGEIIGSTAKALYLFDNEPGWNLDDTYAVRAVGANNISGEWVVAEKLGESTSVSYSSFGDHGESFSKNGWGAETSNDLQTFKPMHWTPAVKSPGADYGGTPNQIGGIEGYWEGGQCAKLGRGWQQSSPDVFCVRSFTSPITGQATLTGRAVKEWYHSEYGCDIDVCVMKNDEIIVPSYTLKRGDISGLSYNMKLDLEKGDVLRFVVGKCDPDINDNTHYEKNANIVAWSTIITYGSDSASGQSYTLRINCGGDNIYDETGNIWLTDKFYNGGYKKIAENPVDGFNSSLYSSYLFAPVGSEISYQLPVPAGIYAVRLCFAETEMTCNSERSMKIVINGKTVESDLDIAHDIRGVNKAFAKLYRYIVPDKNGNINISLTSSLGGSIISGIEIAAENDDIIHINCGGADFVDWVGYIWKADDFYSGGDLVYDFKPELRQAAPTLYDKALYFTGRSGSDFSYHIPVKNGIYSVHLKFAELSFETPGERPIDIYINDYIIKSNWDALSASGEFPMSADIRFDDISSRNGYIDIRIKAKSDNPAILRAIEID